LLIKCITKEFKDIILHCQLQLTSDRQGVHRPTSTLPGCQCQLQLTSGRLSAYTHMLINTYHNYKKFMQHNDKLRNLNQTILRIVTLERKETKISPAHSDFTSASNDFQISRVTSLSSCLAGTLIAPTLIHIHVPDDVDLLMSKLAQLSELEKLVPPKCG
jgi:hypothetical protein